MEQIPNHVILSHWRQLVHKVMQRKVHFQLLLINDIIFTVFGKNLCFCASIKCLLKDGTLIAFCIKLIALKLPIEFCLSKHQYH